MTKLDALRVTDSPFKRRYGNFIGGQWVEPASGRTFANTSPINGRVLCEVARSDATDIDRALDAAHAAKDAWGRTSAAERARLLNAIAQPEQFVEIGEKLANKLGIAHGDTVKVSSNRGYIKAKAVVTKRIRTLNVHGQEVDTIGIPIHWGYEGVAKKGFIANTLTPFVGDANTQTPEFKAFLVNVEKV